MSSIPDETNDKGVKNNNELLTFAEEEIKTSSMLGEADLGYDDASANNN